MVEKHGNSRFRDCRMLFCSTSPSWMSPEWLMMMADQTWRCFLFFGRILERWRFRDLPGELVLASRWRNFTLVEALRSIPFVTGTRRRKGIAWEMRGKYPISKRPWLDWNQFSGDTLYSSVRHFFLYRVSFFRKSFLQFHETGETDIITLHSSPRIITFEQLEYKSKRIQDSLIPREGYIFIFEKHSIYIYIETYDTIVIPFYRTFFHIWFTILRYTFSISPTLCAVVFNP